MMSVLFSFQLLQIEFNFVERLLTLSMIRQLSRGYDSIVPAICITQGNIPIDRPEVRDPLITTGILSRRLTNHYVQIHQAIKAIKTVDGTIKRRCVVKSLLNGARLADI